MKKRISKKILKNKDRLKYSDKQIEKAQKIMEKIKLKNKEE